MYAAHSKPSISNRDLYLDILLQLLINGHSAATHVADLSDSQDTTVVGALQKLSHTATGNYCSLVIFYSNVLHFDFPINSLSCSLSFTQHGQPQCSSFFRTSQIRVDPLYGISHRTFILRARHRWAHGYLRLATYRDPTVLDNSVPWQMKLNYYIIYPQRRNFYSRLLQYR